MDPTDQEEVLRKGEHIPSMRGSAFRHALETHLSRYHGPEIETYIAFCCDVPFPIVTLPVWGWSSQVFLVLESV